MQAKVWKGDWLVITCIAQVDLSVFEKRQLSMRSSVNKMTQNCYISETYILTQEEVLPAISNEDHRTGRRIVV